MGFREMIANWKERKAGVSELSEARRIQENAEARRLSSEERELMRFLEEDRQKKIKEIVQQRRQETNREIWSGRKFNPIFAPNVTAGHPNLFSTQSIFANAPNILKQPKLFFR